MISVLASIRVKAGCREEFLEIFKANVPLVRGEKGCLEYFPAVDLESALAVQAFDPDLVMVIEKWENLDALKAHLVAPHMLVYKERVKDLVEGVSIRVLREA